MTLRDRVYTPTTAKALLSWRLVVGAAVAIVGVLVGLNPVAASLIGLGVYAATVYAAMPRSPKPTRVDPFSVGEPWRHYVQGAQRSRQALAQTVRGIDAGPLRERLTDIAGRLEQAVEESGRIARRGDEIDAAVARIDPVRLRSSLTALQASAGATPSAAATDAIASIESQLATADRLKALSADTADRLRLSQARLDELVARASEVSVGATSTDAYAHDVDNLVIELEALRQAVAETTQAESGPTGTGLPEPGSA